MSAQTAGAEAPQSPILLRETVGSIALLTLNRPAARNSLSEGMIAGLHAALNDIRDDRNVRAVVIAANGSAYSAGHDMKELTARRSDADRGRAYFAEIMNACSAMMQAIVHLPKPVVAAAMEMLLTGEPISAATAQSIGLVNRVVPAGTERDVAIALAQQVALKSAYTVKLGKEAFYRQAEMSLTEAYRFAAEVMTENMMARDAEEGIGAFIEKRDPKWQDNILNNVKSIAMVGASPVNVRPSYFAFKYLAQRGYDMIPVNPGHVGKALMGKPFVASLADIDRPVDMIDIFRNSSHIMPVVDEALKLSPQPK
ncbi:Enoyl-CoA hydratase/isomerase like protein, partial [Aduncisulcus paluster]